MNARAPVPDWKQRTRAGMRMSRRMLLLLQDMRAAREAGWPWVAFNGGVHPRTLRTLLDREWITRSHGLDGARYKITTGGLRALELFERPPRRFDGICPSCGVRPRAVSAGGKELPYCRECLNQSHRRQYALKGHQFAPDSLCPKCGVRPRLTFASGKRHVYCRECRNAQRADERRRQDELDRARIERGEPPLCCRCHKRPRAYTDKTIYDYCEECRREYQREYHARRRQKERTCER